MDQVKSLLFASSLSEFLHLFFNKHITFDKSTLITGKLCISVDCGELTELAVDETIGRMNVTCGNEELFSCGDLTSKLNRFMQEVARDDNVQNRSDSYEEIENQNASTEDMKFDIENTEINLSFPEAHVMNACESEYSLMSKTHEQIKTEIYKNENENTALADLSYGQDEMSDCDHCVSEAHGTFQDTVDLDQSFQEEEVTDQSDRLPTQEQDTGNSVNLKSGLFTHQGTSQRNDENSLNFGKGNN